MEIGTLIILALVIVIILYAVFTYNGLVSLKHNVSKAWSNIDVLLKQRHDELPKLVEVCKQYMGYEKDTLEKIIQTCKRAEASCIFTAVLIEKQINRPRSLLHADFTGLTVPDRYVFGYGMDYKGYLRNCDGIYAVEET